MCFSEGASFTAAAVIGAIGIVSTLSASRPQRMLGFVPILFAIQQFAEGVLWNVLQDDPSSRTVDILNRGITAKYLVMLFTYVLWPVWFPLAFYNCETEKWRKEVILTCVAGGMILSLANLFAILYLEYPVQIIKHSIQYGGVDPAWGKLYYLAVVSIPCFISSLRYSTLMGICLVLSAGIAEYFYFATFASVWCFFGALISILIYWMIKKIPANGSSSSAI